jgi:hypothetical protein
MDLLRMTAAVAPGSFKVLLTITEYVDSLENDATKPAKR